MSKRKILLLALSLCMVAILAAGTTLAYLTDTEVETNVFTIGNVDITLTENFENNKLIPGIDVNKDVFVTNVGSEDAYVRVHIAIPTLLDSGDDDNPMFASYNNLLHWNQSIASMQKGKWNWHKTNMYSEHANYPGWPGNESENWNTYEATVDGVKYTVYIGTFETPLEKGEKTIDAITNVYLDASLDNVHIENILDELGEIRILVAAEAVQAAGFKDAWDAFEKAQKDANKSDGMNIVNLPTNLIDYIYNGHAGEGGVTTDTNYIDE